MRRRPDDLRTVAPIHGSSAQVEASEWRLDLLARSAFPDPVHTGAGADGEWGRYTSRQRRHAVARAIARATDATDAAEPGRSGTRAPEHGAHPWPAQSELRAEVAALREANRRLDGRVQLLERKLDALGSGPAGGDMVPVDPHTRWIAENMDTLRGYPDEWVALHPARGIVFHDTDDDGFAAMLDALSPGERDEILAFHTSMYS